MEFRKVTLSTCAEEAQGVVVVIDVIRAFTTAAFAFAAGAERIMLVATVDEALNLRQRFPQWLVMGEVDGRAPSSFDFSNSPTALLGVDFRGRSLVQRTSAGTQGVVRSRQADVLLTSSFCCANATAAYIRRLSPALVTFVITGDGPDGRGEEDWACSEYLEGLLSGRQPEPEHYIRRVKECRTSQLVFANSQDAQMPWEDIECCTQIDRFDFAMIVERKNGSLVMQPRAIPE